MDVVIPQPELTQLTAEALLVRGLGPEEVHRAIPPSLENLCMSWGVLGDRPLLPSPRGVPHHP